MATRPIEDLTISAAELRRRMEAFTDSELAHRIETHVVVGIIPDTIAELLVREAVRRLRESRVRQ